MSTVTATCQAEIDAALADPTVTRITIDSPEGVWLDYVTNRRDIVADVTGKSCVNRVTGRVGWVGGSGRVDRVVDSGSVDRVVDSGRVGSVGGSGSVGSVVDSGSVGWVGGSGRVGWVVDSGRVDSVGGSGRVGSVVDSGRVGSVVDSGSVGSAAGTSTIHLHGGALEHAGPHVAVFLHSVTATIGEGGHLIDLTDLDLTDLDQWRAHVGADHAVSADRWRLAIPNVSSEDHPGELERGQAAAKIGCWYGTPVELRKMIAGDHWPSGADLETREQYRPRILAFADLCDAQIQAWTEVAR